MIGGSGLGMNPILWRVVQHNPPLEQDFYSHARLGRPYRGTSERAHRLAQGVSVFDSYELAREKARTFSIPGEWTAMLVLVSGGSIQWERGNGGHYTLWGEPADLLARVVQVLPL